MTNTKILAIDTALQATSACVFEAGADAPEAMETIAMARGHAEALVPLIERVMARVPGGFPSLSRVAVTVGPGSFTGLRIGIAAARAIGIACNVPVVGVVTLAALAAPLILQQRPGQVVAAIDAHHGNIYVAVFGPDGRAVLSPCLMTIPDAIQVLEPGPIRLVGSGAPMLAVEALAKGRSVDLVGDDAAPDVAFVAKLGQLADPQVPARPLYLKAPDAKPQSGNPIALAP